MDASLPALVTAAAQRLAAATDAAQVLEAKVLAGAAYDAAKAAIRLAKAQRAADEVIAIAHRAEADALEIEAGAKRKLADEYDAAQAAGAVAKLGSNQHAEGVPGANSLGIDRKDIMEGRRFNEAETAEPGVMRRILEEQVIKGDEPTRAQLRREVESVVTQAMNGEDFGLGHRRRRPGRTLPDPNFDAMAQVAGCCRRLVELVEANGVEAIRAGFLSEGMRHDTVQSFRDARDALTELIEVCDDEAHQLQADPGHSEAAEARR